MHHTNKILPNFKSPVFSIQFVFISKNNHIFNRLQINLIMPTVNTIAWTLTYTNSQRTFTTVSFPQ